MGDFILRTGPNPSNRSHLQTQETTEEVSSEEETKDQSQGESK